MNDEGGSLKGDFVMMVREVLFALKSPDFSTHEKSIIAHVADITVGYHCGLRELSREVLMKELTLSRTTVTRSLGRLLKIKVLRRKSIGNRQYEYGLNKEYFGRIYPGDVSNISYLDRYKEDRSQAQSRAYQGSEVGLHGPIYGPEKVCEPAPTAAKVKIKHTSNIDLKISLREIRTFVNSRSRNTKQRWINLINKIIANHVEDQQLLWLAIETVERTQIDFFGKPIYSSTLNFFEGSSWPGMKAAFLEKLRIEKELAEKEKRSKETEALIAAKRQRFEQESNESNFEEVKEISRKFSILISGGSLNAQ